MEQIQQDVEAEVRHPSLHSFWILKSLFNLTFKVILEHEVTLNQDQGREVKQCRAKAIEVRNYCAYYVRC